MSDTVKPIRDSRARLSRLFQILTDQEFDALVRSADVLELDFGSPLFQAEDRIDNIYVLLSGKIRLTVKSGDRQETLVLLTKPGEVFGSIIPGGVPGYGARTSAECQILRIPADSCRKLLAVNGQFGAVIKRELQMIDWQEKLQNSVHIEGLTPANLRLLLSHAELASLAQGAKIDQAQTEPRAFSLVLSGNLVYPEGGTLLPGQYVSSQADPFDTNGKTVAPRASQPSEILVIDSAKLRGLFQDFPALETEVSQYKQKCSIKRDNQNKTERLRKIETLPVAQQQAQLGLKPRETPALEKLRRKFGFYPILFQQNAMDCGSTCIAMVSLFYGERLDLNKVREMAHVGSFGTSLYALAETAEKLGYMCRGISATYEGLMQLTPPLICFWKGEHFVVLYEAKETGAIVGDPAEGLRHISPEAFEKDYSGVCLELLPTQKFGSAAKQSNLFKRLLPFLKPYKFEVMNVFIATLLYQVLMLIIPLFTQTIVDKVVVHQSLSLLNTMTLGMCLFAIFETVVTFIRGYLQAYLAIRLDQSLIIQFFRHLLSLPFKFFEDRTIGDIITRFGENQKIRDFLASSGITVLLDFVVVLIYLAVIYGYHVLIGVSMTVYLAIFTVLVVIYTPILRQLGRLVFNRYAESQSFLIEGIRSIQLVKASAAENRVRWRWEILLVDQLEARFREMLANNTVQCISRVVQLAGQIFLLWLGADLVLKNELTVGQLMAINMMVGMIGMPVMRIVEMWGQLQDVGVALERLCDVLDHDPEEPEGSAKVRLDNISGNVKFENVTFRYGASATTNTLENLNLEVRAGQLAAVVGRSGCGKTTLIKLIQGLYAPNSGKVFIDGIDLAQLSLTRVRQQIGVVSQNEYLFRGTVKENLAFNKPAATMEEIVEAATIAGVHDVILELPMGYDTILSEGGFNLSGGQRQRMSIARAILHRPAILLFDEATSALDTESERRIQDSMEMIRKNRTMFVVAHRLSTVKDADIIFVVDRGHIVETGTHDSLLKQRGLYYYLCSQQISM